MRIDRSARSRPGGWRWLVGLLLLLTAGGVTALVLWQRGKAPVEVRVVTVTAPRAGEAARQATVLNATGYVTARRRATVSSEVTGKLVDVSVEEGMPVSAGQELARLDDTLYRANLELAESQLAASRRAVVETVSNRELAEANDARARRLLQEKVIGQATYDEARTRKVALQAREDLERQQVKVAEAQVLLRRVELEDTVITAPYDGIVISKDAQEGEMVSPISAGGGFTRTGICTIVDMSSLEIEVDVNESYIARVTADQPVEAVLDAYPDWRIPARVITTIPAADRQKATVLVRIGFVDLDPRILPDMGVKVSFLESGAAAPDEQAAAMPTVPRDAVRQQDGRDVVLVVEGDRVERRGVRLGGAQGDRVTVLAGVQPGERLVVSGPEGLADGDRIRVVP